LLELFQEFSRTIFDTKDCLRLSSKVLCMPIVRNSNSVYGLIVRQNSDTNFEGLGIFESDSDAFCTLLDTLHMHEVVLVWRQITFSFRYALRVLVRVR
jgi:hypothetical protein